MRCQSFEEGERRGDASQPRPYQHLRSGKLVAESFRVRIPQNATDRSAFELM
jgi:hypothetical protein